MRYLLKHSVKILSAAVIVGTFLSYLSPYINPNLFRWAAFFGTAFPWFLMANVALLGIWAFRLNRFAVYHLGMLVFGWQHVTAFIGLNISQNVAPESAITVATHNLGGLFRGINLEDDEWAGIFTNYVQFLKDNGDPGILCVQETGRKFFKALGPKLGLPHTFELNRSGTAILSRYPVLRGGQLPFGQKENTSIWADVRIGKRTVRVYNVHLQSNKVTYDTERVIEDSNLQDEETWRGHHARAAQGRRRHQRPRRAGCHVAGPHCGQPVPGHPVRRLQRHAQFVCVRPAWQRPSPTTFRETRRRARHHLRRGDSVPAH
jgi:hypothetical protein